MGGPKMQTPCGEGLHPMSGQDSDPVYRLLHVTLAASYCNAARLLAADDELMRATNVDVHTRLRELEIIQRKLLTKVQRGGGGGGDAGGEKKKAPAKGVAIDTGPTWM